MQRLSFLSIFAAVLLFFACAGENTAHKASEQAADATAGTRASAKAESKVEVIDFYGTHRCATCIAIESNAQYTVKTFFANDPRVVFKSVNVDDPANAEIAEKFEAAGTALYLNVIKDGNETQIDLTNFAFTNGNDKEKFSEELKGKIENELKNL